MNFHRRKIPDTVQTEYYVHYEGFNRRLDEWVKSDRIKRQQDRDNSPRVSTTPINADGESILFSVEFKAVISLRMVMKR